MTRLLYTFPKWILMRKQAAPRMCFRENVALNAIPKHHYHTLRLQAG
jgi:hypothetical protein